MNARVLFTVAAIFNAVIGLAMLLAYDSLSPWLGFPPEPTVWMHIIALIVLVFGYAYWRIAMDPVRFREYVILGIVGKLSFVVVTYGHFIAGGATSTMAMLVTADLVFAGFFAAYLARTPASVRR